MKKIRLLFHRDTITEGLRAVQRSGVVELTDVTDQTGLYQNDKPKSHVFEHNVSRLDFAIKLIETYTGQKKAGLRGFFEGTFETTTHEEADTLLTTYPYHAHIEALERLEHDINTLTLKKNDTAALIATLTPWLPFSIDLSLGLTTRTTQTLLLEATPEITERIEGALKDFGVSEISFHRFSPRTVTLTFLHTNHEIVSRVLNEHKVVTLEFPQVSGVPSVAREQLTAELVSLERQLEEKVQAIKNFGSELRSLKIISDVLHWRTQKHHVIDSGLSTEHVFVFEGWCEAEKFNTLIARVAKATPYADITEIPTDEEPPVELKNNSFVRPFETVTRLYGLPGSRDLDPTIFLASFFFIFFGLCLTDVGYGIFLALATGIPLLIYRVQDGLKLMLQLLCFGGIASVIVGLFFGGYLGADMSLLPSWLQAIQAFDPIADPLPVLLLALGLGVVQIVFGLCLKIVRAIKDNDTVNGLLDTGPWLLFFLSIGLFLGKKMDMLPDAVTDTSVLYDIYVSVILLVLTQGRKEKNIFMKLIKGVLSLYDSVSYFSDILSYSRILALGLATSALAFAINLIASIAKDMIPVVGPVVMVLILVVGHIFNVGINALGAFIHSARLQFVEFFGKFITASGRPFMPFRQTGRYTTIKQ